MKPIHLLASVLLIVSCNNSQKEVTPTSEMDEPSEISVAPLKEQDGEFSRLYALSDACKLTLEEVASTFSLSVAQMSTHIEVVSPCLFNVTYRDGSKGIFSIRAVKTPQKVVQKEIESMLASSYQSKFIKPSTSGGHYIYKHPNQGYLLVSHPNYANRIKIQYMVMVSSNLTPTQKEYVENKAYQTANYLIAKYED